MSQRRKVAFLCLSICAAILYGYRTSILRHVGVRHVRNTVIVSAGMRPLGGLFDGLSADPRFAASRLLKDAQKIPCTGDRSKGLLGSLAALFERTAHAQPTCTYTDCYGNYYQSDEWTCYPGCSPTYFVEDSEFPNNGFANVGFAGCTGNLPQCTGICNQLACQNCAEIGQACGPSMISCGPGTICSDYGVCQSIE